MKEIIFKKNFKKLHNQEFALLLCIRVKFGKELCKEFIEYDTDNEYEIDKEQKYMILYFYGNKLIPFTSLRKFNNENVYKYQINEHYKIITGE